MGILLNGRECGVLLNGRKVGGYLNGQKVFGGLLPEKRIAYENGRKTIQYITDSGVIVNGVTSLVAGRILGNKDTGILYWYYGTNGYKQNLSTGITTLLPYSSLIIPERHSLTIHPETKSAVMTKIATNSQVYVTNNIETTPFSSLSKTYYAQPFWYNDRCLIKRTYYDTNWQPIATLEHSDFDGYDISLQQFGDNQTGFFVCSVNNPSNYQHFGKIYKVNNDNTLTEYWNTLDAPNASYKNNVLFDAWNKIAVIGRYNSPFYTFDGDNYQYAYTANNYTSWYASMSPLIGLSVSYGNFYNAYTKTAGNNKSENSMFPTSIGINAYAYDGFGMCGDETLLLGMNAWDVVPRIFV